MSFAVILQNGLNVAKSLLGNGLLLVRKKAPEIMVGFGLAGFGVTIVETVKATNAVNDILNDRDESLESLKSICDNSEQGSIDYEEAAKKINRGARWGIVRAVAKPVGTGILSGTLILSGFGKLNGRYVATAAAYEGLQGQVDRYRGLIAEKYGKDEEWALWNHHTQEEMEAERKRYDEVKARKAETSTKNPFKKEKAHNYYERGIHSALFDEYSEHWRRYWTAQRVWDYLVMKEKEAEDKFQLQGHLFENEVRDMLGLERTTEGAVTGWIKTRSNPNSHVSFGLKDIPEDVLRDFLKTERNEDIRIWLNFNVDGLIYNMIEKRKDPITEYVV